MPNPAADNSIDRDIEPPESGKTEAEGDAEAPGCPPAEAEPGDRGEEQDEQAEAPPAPKDATLLQRLRAWLGGAPLSFRTHLLLGLFAPMVLVVVNAWRVRAFTVDDAYISFRYAENLATGHGLVYNVGERVEGYTNFLWTVLLAGFVKTGLGPEIASKILGISFACAALVPLFFLSNRLRPLETTPCLATWLLASSFIFTGYSAFGLESSLFILLVLAGAELFYREEDAEEGFPYSGLVFGLAALTRPEAPLFLGMLLLWQMDLLRRRQNLIRLGIFALVVGGHLLFRLGYYGDWLPTTFRAKTGDIQTQLRGGRDYLRNYLGHIGPIVWLALGSVALSIVNRRREGLAIASTAILLALYVVLVGGDWMPLFRFMAPIEPFLFLLIDDTIRAITERRDRASVLAIVAFALICAVLRVRTLNDARRDIMKNDKAFWDDAAGRSAEWFVKHAEPGPIALADIGYIGYRTGYPIVDMLGLLAPEIARLPGAYTRKTGVGYMDAIFKRDPRYFLIIATGRDCKNPTVPSSRASFYDRRFQSGYRLRQAVGLAKGGAWCIFEKKSASAPSRPAGRLPSRPPSPSP